jgi:tetratricopeptide (TPR) repeat protein
MTLPPWRTLAIVAGAVVALVLLGTGAWLWSAAQQERGTAAYAEILLKNRTSENAQTTPEARETAIRDLERVLGDYPSNAMAPQAAYLLGNLRFTSGQYDRARAAWQLTASRARSSTIATLARAGVGYAWEAERKLPEASQAFEAALADLKPTAFYYEELLSDLARVQELSGKKDAAIATYRRLLKDVPKSPRAADVRTRLGSLGATP